MKAFSLLIVCLGFSFSMFAQEPDYNLGFEQLTNGVVNGWYMKSNDDCRFSVDTVTKYSGKNSLLIERISNKGKRQYDMAALIVPAKYHGSDIEIRTKFKLEKVEGFANLIVKVVDVNNEKLVYGDLLKTRISGTKDWQTYSVKLPYQAKTAQKIYIWPLLDGLGKLWIDEVEILIDGKPFAEAELKSNFDANPPLPIKYGDNISAGNKVKVKDAEIYYETYGKGDPLLLLHGNSQSISYLRVQIREFSKYYKVIALDTRSQGKSIDTNNYPLTYDLFAEDMKTLMDSLKIKNANIYGWSDGGNTALIMASKYPTYVNKIAITGAVMHPSTDAVSNDVLQAVKKTINSLRDRSDSASKQQLRLYSMLLKEPHLTDVDLRRIKAKSLIMAGEKDMVLESHTTHIASQIPNAKKYIFKGATHYVPVEIPNEFNRVVLDFFKE